MLGQTIILCYGLGSAIIEFVSRTEACVKELTDNYELVLVANYLEGSDDRTRDFVAQIADENPKCKTVCKPKEGMMGWDMRSGMDEATGKYICIIDGDGQFPIESIAACYEIISTTDNDLVKTYRAKGGDGFYRKLISRVYNVLFSSLFPGINTKDANSKPKILTASAYEQMSLKSDDWFIDAEIMLNVRDLKFNEFPIEFYELAGRSSFVKLPAVWEFIKNLVEYRLGGSKEK
ncbi:MAG TPA: hypothetical protein DCR04_12530 [Flavobacteriales bacterium]|nr:hypothetical protein [Flavobacteriales bacterium]